MKIPIYQVDAFTNNIFEGNYAAVCLLEEWPETNMLQSISAENNLPETAFFIQKDKAFEIRWFTPEIEVDLCGHATLATAHVIFQHYQYPEEVILFNSKSGELRVSKSGKLLTMDFPASKPSPVEIPEKLSQALGLTPQRVYKSRDYLAVYENEEQVLSIDPDLRLLSELDVLGIIITARGKRSDFVSRFFAPAAGIDEDPVTGSAHTTLIPFWAEELNKNKLHAIQVSKRRGELFCEYKGDRVLISGQAVTYLKGEIFINDAS